jgi:hypothetical protein
MVVDLRQVKRRVGDHAEIVLQYRHLEGPAGRVRWSDWKDVPVMEEDDDWTDAFIPEPTD